MVKLDEQAQPPKIDIAMNEDGRAQLFYFSQHKLCYLAEGLLNGAAEHYEILIQTQHLQSMYDENDFCEFRIVEHEQH